MKKFGVLGLFILGILCSCRSPMDSSEETLLKVLFLGDRHAMHYDVPGMVERLADGAGFSMEAVSIVKPTGLKQIAQDTTVMDTLFQRPWDMIVLQAADYSIAFDESRYLVYEYVQYMRGLIHEQLPLCKVIFPMDFAFDEGVWDGSELIPRSEFQELIRRGTKELADSLDMVIAPVGWAWEQVRTDRPDLILFYDYSGYPSYEGSFFSACVYFCTLFKANAENSSYIYAPIDSEDGHYLKQMATQTVFNHLDEWNIEGGEK